MKRRKETRKRSTGRRIILQDRDDDLPLDSNGTNNRARGIFKLVSMHPLSEILAENDRREVARLEDEDEDEEPDLTILLPQELEERRCLKRE